MKHRAGVLVILLVAILGLLGSINIRPAQAQASGSERDIAPSSPPSPDEQEIVRRYFDVHPAAVSTQSYSWTAGTSFQPRSSVVQRGYLGGGCVHRTNTSGNPDEDAFTAAVHLPQGATILGVRLYSYDAASTGNSQLFIARYNGAGAFTNIASQATSGSSGYSNAFVALTTPYTVDNTAASLALVWYADSAGSELSLCGAQIVYIAPYAYRPSATETVDSVATESAAAFVGSAFYPRTSNVAFRYRGNGCISSSTGGSVTIDVDLPTGARVNTVKMYFYDASTTGDLDMFLTTYNGNGGLTDRLVFNNGTAVSGFGTQTAIVPTPFVVDQFLFSTVLSVTMLNDPNVWLCGAQIGFTPPAGITAAPAPVRSNPQSVPAQDEAVTSAATANLYRWIAGSTFITRYANTTYTYKGAGCVSITGGTPIINTDVHLPNGAHLLGARFYYFDSSTSNSVVFMTEYDGAGRYNEFITANSTGSAGYSSTYVTPSTPYIVNNAVKGLGIAWNSSGVLDTTMALCGVRLYYSTKVSSYLFLPLVER